MQIEVYAAHWYVDDRRGFSGVFASEAEAVEAIGKSIGAPVEMSQFGSVYLAGKDKWYCTGRGYVSKHKIDIPV